MSVITHFWVIPQIHFFPNLKKKKEKRNETVLF
jgi:hypothetical protein